MDIGQAKQTFIETQAEFNRLSSKPDLRQSSNLGTLNSQILIKNGILTTPVFQISAPTFAANGKGMVNLNLKTLNYMLYIHLYGPQNAMVNHLIFPYHMTGQLNNINGSVNQNSVQNQIVTYYTDNVGGTVSSIGTSVTKDTKSVIKSTNKFIKNLFN